VDRLRHPSSVPSVAPIIAELVRPLNAFRPNRERGATFVW
jgi:hypothetical protein